VSDASGIEPGVDPHLITISGRSTEALRELARRYRDFLHDGLSLADVAFSANLGRSHFKCRVGCVASGVREFRAQLDGFLAGQTCPGLFVGGRLEYQGGEPGELALRYVRGEDVDLKAYHRIHPGRKIRLPNYPFQRDGFWVGSLLGSHRIHPLIEAIGKGEVSRIEQILEGRLSPEDIPALGRIVRALAGEFAGEPPGRPVGGRQLLGPFMEAKSSGDREAHLTELLQEEIAGLLRMAEPPDPDAGFFDLGMDSITALELREQLEVRLGTALPASLAFDCPNIRALSRYLMGINSPTEKETALAGPSTNSEAAPTTPQSRDGIATRLARLERLTQTRTPVD
jgi:acyl carrier protein